MFFAVCSAVSQLFDGDDAPYLISYGLNMQTAIVAFLMGDSVIKSNITRMPM